MLFGKSNKEIALRFYEFFNKGDLEGLRDIFDPNVIDHNPVPGQPAGFEGIKQSLEPFRTAFPDMQVKVEDILVDGDKVVLRILASGTHTGDLLGIPPTGRTVTVQGIDIYRILDDKIVEVWHVEDLFGLMQQLGVVSIPATAGTTA